MFTIVGGSSCNFHTNMVWIDKHAYLFNDQSQLCTYCINDCYGNTSSLSI